MSAEVSRFVFVPEFVCNGIVEKEAFLPPPTPRPYETSVIIHGNEGVPWKVGRQIGLARKKQCPLVGSAEFREIDATLSGLALERSPSKISENHANLKGWNEDDKMRRIEQAEMISLRSNFVPADNQKLIEENE